MAPQELDPKTRGEDAPRSPTFFSCSMGTRGDIERQPFFVLSLFGPQSADVGQRTEVLRSPSCARPMILQVVVEHAPRTLPACTASAKQHQKHDRLAARVEVGSSRMLAAVVERALGGGAGTPCGAEISGSGGGAGMSVLATPRSGCPHSSVASACTACNLCRSFEVLDGAPRLNLSSDSFCHLQQSRHLLRSSVLSFASPSLNCPAFGGVIGLGF